MYSPKCFSLDNAVLPLPEPTTANNTCSDEASQSDCQKLKVDGKCKDDSTRRKCQKTCGLCQHWTSE